MLWLHIECRGLREYSKVTQNKKNLIPSCAPYDVSYFHYIYHEMSNINIIPNFEKILSS